MERFWNIIHYFVYKIDYRFHLFFNKINPVLYFYKLPFAKRHFKKIGIDPIIELNKAFEQPDIGISTIRSGGMMYLLVFLVCLGLGNIFIGIYRIRFNVSIIPFILALMISFAVNYYLLFRHKKYLNYFKEFDNMEIELKIKLAWISIGLIFGILIFCMGSFIFMIYRL